MTDKAQDLIPTAAATFRDLLVEAAQASQAGPTVGLQQAEAKAEIAALDRILAASDAAMQELARFQGSRRIAHYENALGELEGARVEAAALAEVGGNKRLAKACRAVAQVRRRSDSLSSKPDRVEKPEERSLRLKTIKAEIKDADNKARALLTSCRAHAHAQAASAQRHRAQIDEWKQQQAAIQASIHALATLARIPATSDQDACRCRQSFPAT